ncbi:hypothetical protein KUCAC02_001477, partial [Chaenocephalus aceratus]
HYLQQLVLLTRPFPIVFGLCLKFLRICGCSTASERVNPGKVVAVVTTNGRHDLSMPELSCHTCDATRAAGLDDLIQSGYWPATLHFSTMYETDVFYSFEEMKMAIFKNAGSKNFPLWPFWEDLSRQLSEKFFSI